MIETLRDFVEKAKSLGIEFMVTGSYAMSAFGEIRMTRDIDVVIQIDRARAKDFFELFKDDYYVSDEGVRNAIARRSMFNVISLAHGGKIDCIVMKDSDFARQSFRRRWKATVAGIEFWTITKEDLIISKLNWARDSRSEMQIRDIANLTDTEYDSAYVNSWIDRLRLNDIWSEVGQWKIRRATAEE